MEELQRITQPTLDVLEVLLEATQQGATVHGWAIMKTIKRSGPTVYKVLDRLEDAGWIVGEWEELGPDQAGPRRRFYRLTGEGALAAQNHLAQRRPQTFRLKPTTGFASLIHLRRMLFGSAQ
ncbi:PadR family transcriptional regulator [Herbidospora mongoliensis]|uniref:PadR family transcriptional regulator n=1 Tax=Herbidospora mongoliensis TaxID=688067 RepID=UPI000831D55C|nr:PadR family transcriptional regulator [Herbidospora mongoliensis]